MYIRPLTHRNNDGEVYERTDEVIGQIRAALALEPEPMLKRALIRSYEAPGYLREECLIYLVREYLRKGAASIAKRLSEILCRRCAKSVNERLRALGSRYVDDAFNDVLKEMFERINDLENDRGDYFQVRFWVALKGLTIRTFGRYVKKIEREKREQKWIRIGADPASGSGEDDAPDPLASAEEPMLPVGDTPVLKEGLNAIKDFRHRTAFALRCFGGIQTESKDPEEPTISNFFETTPRTIRNWLKQAEKDLEEWRGKAT